MAFLIRRSICYQNLQIIKRCVSTLDSKNLPNPLLAPVTKRIPRVYTFVRREVFHKLKVDRSLADAVVLDMEDSVPADEKGIARSELFKIIGSVNLPPLYIRINALSDGSEWREDLEVLSHKNLAGFFVSKVGHPDEIKLVDEIVSRIEIQRGLPKNSLRLVPLIENIEGLHNVFDIASASKRIEALAAGNYDFAADAIADLNSETLDHFNVKVLLAARKNGLVPIYGASTLIDSHAEFIRETQRIKKMGYYSRVALTPIQSALSKQVFTVDGEDLIKAKAFTSSGKGISTYRRSIQESRIAVGPPHQKWAENLLKISDYQNSVDSNKLFPKRSGLKPKMHPGMTSNGKYKVGDIINSPFEITVDQTYLALWEAAFVNAARIYSSDKFCQKIGLQNRLIPYNYLLTMTVGMSVIRFSEEARCHLGFYNAQQFKPAYVGDTFTNRFVIISVTLSSSNPLHCIVRTHHKLINQNNDVVFTVEKRTMFEDGHFQPSNELEEGNCDKKSGFRQHVIDSYRKEFIKVDRPYLHKVNDVFVHRYVKVFGDSETRGLSCIIRAVNAHHVNTVRYSHEDILVPGPLVTAAAVSNLLFDYGEILYEEYPVLININKVNYGDVMSTVSKVLEINDIQGEDVEEVKMRLIGIINMDPSSLENIGLPSAIFENEQMKPRNIEKLLSSECPELFHRIACIIDRVVLRPKAR